MKTPLIFAAILAAHTAAIPQNATAPRDSAAQTVTVIPGPEYEAGWVHRLFYGSNWRDLWTSPLVTTELNLHTFAGGLTPRKKGGGKQTISLKFDGKDGEQYNFRSLNKDARQSLPKDLQKTIAGDFLQDQISSQNPASPLLVSPLLAAVGVTQMEPTIAVMPKDPALGEYLEEFGGMLGSIEMVPRSERFDSEDILSTFKLFRRLEKNSREQVNAREFLKARLMDVYLGDWDRHADQWRWFSQEQGTDRVWVPIPRDRDWAFARFNGVVPWIAEATVPELKGFDEDYPDLDGLTWKGHHLDRWFLVPLGKDVWDSLSSFIASRLTDSLIRQVVHRLPRNMYDLEGGWMEAALIARKASFHEMADQYYHMCAEFPDIHASNEAEYAEINFIRDGHLLVSIYTIDRESGQRRSVPFFRREFSDDTTKDLRIYLFGGDDSVIASGSGRCNITIKIIAGEGNDYIANNSGNRIDVYDSDDVRLGSAEQPVSLDREVVTEETTDSARYESRFRDYGHRWKGVPWGSITSDYGPFLGWHLTLNDYAFRAHPVNYNMRFRAGMSVSYAKFRVDYRGRFYSLVRGARVTLYANLTQLESTHYFGMGNETPFSSTLNTASFYRVHQQNFVFEPSLEYPVEKSYQFRVGGQIRHVRTDHTETTLLNQEQPYGAEDRINIGKFLTEFSLDSRNSQNSPSEGFYFNAGYEFFPKILDSREDFSKIRGEVRTYLSPDSKNHLVLALRLAGEKIWGGQYPFFESARAGGYGSLRGYSGDRFRGTASVYGSGELRWSISGFRFLLPGNFGLLTFTDAGRVYLKGEDSGLLHYGYGGGVWFGFLNDGFILNATFGKSKERLTFSLGGGFAF